MKNCADCSKALRPVNTSGLCRDCINARLQVSKPACDACGVKLHGTPKSGLCFTCLHEKDAPLVASRIGRCSRFISAAQRVTLWRYEEIVGEGRTKPLINVRHAVALLARQQGMSYPQIGKVMRRDHTSIMHACIRANDLQGRDKHFAALVKAIEAAA